MQQDKKKFRKMNNYRRDTAQSVIGSSAENKVMKLIKHIGGRSRK